MRPRPGTGKLPQKQRGRDCAALHDRVAGVAHVGDRRVDRRPVVLDQRHPPHTFAGCLPGHPQRLRQDVVGGEQPGVPAAEPDGDRAGQRGQVHDDVRIEDRVGIGQRVGEHEAALGVGVGDLDRRTAVVPDHVAGALGGTRGHVLRRRHQRGDPQRQVQCRQHAHRAQHRSTAAHVRLHRHHALGRLQRQAAGVKGNALADQYDVAARVRRRIRDLDQPGRPGGPGANGQDAAEALRRQLAPTADADVEASAPAENLGLFRQPLRRLLQRRCVGQLAGQRASRRGRDAGVDRRPGRGHVRDQDRDVGQDGRLGHPTALEAVRPEQQPFDMRADCGWVTAPGQRRAQRRSAAGPPSQCGAGLAQRRRRTVPDAGQQQQLRPTGTGQRDGSDFSRLALGLLPLQVPVQVG